MRVDAFTDLERLTDTLHATGVALGVAPEAAGHHAGELETSILLGLRSGDVRSAIAPGLVTSSADPQALFYPDLRANAPSGTIGDARAADGARAERYLAAWTAVLAAAYRGDTNSA